MNKQPFELVNEIGYEAYIEIARKVREQPELPEKFYATAMACSITLANALGPAIAAANDRSKAADDLVATCMKRVREFVEPAVGGNG